MDAEDWRYWFEERAAIREYEGGFKRQDAELLAYLEVQEKVCRDRGVNKSEALNIMEKLEINRPSRANSELSQTEESV